MARKKELYLHIGTVKTGTTALQQFFSANRDVLRKKGIIYPQNKDGFFAHHRLVWASRKKRGLSRWNWPEDMGQPEEEWSFVLNQLTCEKAIISSEHFIGCAAVITSEVKKFISEFRVKLVVYWRRRDALENSWYNQLIKGDDLKDPPSYKPDLTSWKNLTLWANIFGKENVILRPYEKHQLYQRDVPADFLHHILGLELTDEFVLPVKDINPGLHCVVLEYKRQVNHLPISPVLLNQKVVNPLLAASNMLTKKGRKSYPVFPPQQRLQLIEEYTEENAAIAREFLGRKDGKLFYDPLPDLDEDWQPYNELLEEDAKLINRYLAENHPDGLRTIIRGIFQAQYSDNIKIRQAALKLLPGISHSHLIDTLSRNLKGPTTEGLLFTLHSQLEQIYSSKTWKTGMVLNCAYNKIPGIIKKPVLKATRELYHLANRP